MKNQILAIILLLLFSSCTEINTTKPTEVYKNWTDSNPPKNLQLINGKYWQSANWSKEYIMTLKIKPTKKWWYEFVSQNQLELDTTKWIKPNDLPKWFKPSVNSIMYKMSGDFDQGSRYFFENKSGECYIYEIQL